MSPRKAKKVPAAWVRARERGYAAANTFLINPYRVGSYCWLEWNSGMAKGIAERVSIMAPSCAQKPKKQRGMVHFFYRGQWLAMRRDRGGFYVPLCA
jgi:hypothetical protein